MCVVETVLFYSVKPGKFFCFLCSAVSIVKLQWELLKQICVFAFACLSVCLTHVGLCVWTGLCLILVCLFDVCGCGCVSWSVSLGCVFLTCVGLCVWAGLCLIWVCLFDVCGSVCVSWSMSHLGVFDMWVSVCELVCLIWVCLFDVCGPVCESWSMSHLGMFDVCGSVCVSWSVSFGCVWCMWFCVCELVCLIWVGWFDLCGSVYVSWSMFRWSVFVWHVWVCACELVCLIWVCLFDVRGSVCVSWSMSRLGVFVWRDVYVCELVFKAKKYFCRINVDRSPTQSLQMERFAHFLFSHQLAFSLWILFKILTMFTWLWQQLKTKRFWPRPIISKVIDLETDHWNS